MAGMRMDIQHNTRIEIYKQCHFKAPAKTARASARAVFFPLWRTVAKPILFRLFSDVLTQLAQVFRFNVFYPCLL